MLPPPGKIGVFRLYKMISEAILDHSRVDCGTELLFDLEEIVDMWNRKSRRAAV